MENSALALSAQQIKFDRLEAVNGWELSEADVEKVYDSLANQRHARYPLVRPEIGCYLSHIECWKKIAAGEAPGGIVFEDDISVSPDLGDVLKLISSDATADWDIVKLFSFDDYPKTVAKREFGKNHQLVVPYRVPTCLIGYAITKTAARKLASSSLPFFRPVDEDMKFFWEKQLRVSLVLPPPISVGDQQAVTGTIGNERRSAKRGNRFLHGLLYQLRYRANLHFHRMLGRP